MTNKPTIAEALAVPNAAHVVQGDGTYTAYAVGESLPAHAKTSPLSPAERQALLDAVEPLFADLRTQAQNALDTNATFSAVATPSNAQLIAQAKVLTQQNTKIINVLLRLLGIQAL